MMIFGAIVTPIVFACFIGILMCVKDLKSWQHYACLTSLVFLISILFLLGSGRVQNLSVGGNSVSIVSEKLVEVQNLTEQNKQMAINTVSLIEKATSGLLATVGNDEAGIRKSEENLLRSAGLSDAEIKSVFNGSKTNTP